ncbi:hypothetical protein EKO27_g6116 [Xylaria grammica]|uniref:Transferase family protein n=1 Tax=Xylaria grammica TaxID=363999 RepID=A0A439D3M0_9PEZI|nr:hypothetical protein EKO27_g6116 [Xylaria grammica]
MGLQHVYTTLNPLDHIPPKNYVKFAFYLPLTPTTDTTTAFDRLHEGLHRTFLQFPWLNGKAYNQSPDTPGWRPGQLEIRHSPLPRDGPRPYQLKLNIIDSPDYEEIKELGFPTSTFGDEELLWAPFIPSVDDGAEVFVAQANFVPGGCILCAAIFHPVSDGTATATLFKVWADNCKNAQGLTRDESSKLDVLPPGSDNRGLLDDLWAREGSGRAVKEIKDATWRILGLDTPVTASDTLKAPTEGDAKIVEAPSRKMNSSIFYVSPENFARLRTDCAHQPGSTNGHLSPISGNDAICALIWQSLIKARASARMSTEGHDPPQEQDPLACLEMTLDGRPDFSTALPPSYLGNVILINQSYLPLARITSTNTTLSEVAHVIRENGSRIQPESILDAYTLVKNIPDFNELKLRFTAVEGNDMMITSLLKFPASLNFGDDVFENNGQPEAIRPLMGGFETFFRISFILPMKSHGGVEFVVSLYDDEMEKLLQDEEFGKYAMFLS